MTKADKKNEKPREERNKFLHQKYWQLEFLETLPFSFGDFTMTHLIHESADTRVYQGGTRYDMKVMAMKFERRHDRTLNPEAKALRAINMTGRKKHLPQIFYHNSQPGFRFIAMTRLGKNLDEYKWNIHEGAITRAESARLVLQALHGLKTVHDYGFVHRDIQPKNLVFGNPEDANSQRVHLIDFAKSRQYAMQLDTGEWRFRPNRRNIKNGPRSYKFAPPCRHERVEYGRKDDLWALLYTLVDLQGKLPWEEPHDHSNKEEMAALLDLKLQPDEWLFKEMPPMRRFVEHLEDLNINERPCYDMMKNCLWDVIEIEEGKTDAERRAWGRDGEESRHLQLDVHFIDVRQNAWPERKKQVRIFDPAPCEMPSCIGFRRSGWLRREGMRRQKKYERAKILEQNMMESLGHGFPPRNYLLEVVNELTIGMPPTEEERKREAEANKMLEMIEEIEKNMKERRRQAAIRRAEEEKKEAEFKKAEKAARKKIRKEEKKKKRAEKEANKQAAGGAKEDVQEKTAEGLQEQPNGNNKDEKKEKKEKKKNEKKEKKEKKKEEKKEKKAAKEEQKKKGK